MGLIEKGLAGMGIKEFFQANVLNPVKDKVTGGLSDLKDTFANKAEEAATSAMDSLEISPVTVGLAVGFLMEKMGGAGIKWGLLAAMATYAFKALTDGDKAEPEPQADIAASDTAPAPSL